MDEDSKNNEGEKDTKSNFRERNKQERLELIKSENEVAERMEKANSKREEQIGREEDLADVKQLSGDSEAGKKQEEKKEENPHEYRVRIEQELAQGKTEFGS